MKIPSYQSPSYKDELHNLYKIIEKAGITPEQCLTENEGEALEQCYKGLTFFYGNRELSVNYKGYLFIFDVNCYNGEDWEFDLFDAVDEL
jgi:hypothetical protein